MGPLRLVPVGFQQLDASDLASAVHLTVPVGAQVAVLSVTGDGTSVSWRDDGTAPTDSEGIIISAGDPPYEYWGTLSAIQFILASGSPALNVSFYKIAG